MIRRHFAARLAIALIALPLAAHAAVAPGPRVPWRLAADETAKTHGSAYRDGQRALDAGKWKEAADAFARVAAAKGGDVDAALYWQAYALGKQGSKAEALAALRTLRSDFPKSSWLDDAQALELEMRGPGVTVQPADSAAEKEELAVYALNSLMQSDSARAVPVLQKYLQGNHSERLKKQALFVLGQSDAPGARQLLVDVAHGKTAPGMQHEAVDMLGVAGDEESVKALGEVYRSSQDREIKEAVLHAYLVADAQDELLAAARGERDAELRHEAIHQLGAMDAGPQLRALYAEETSTDLRRAVLEAMGVAGDVEGLAQAARTTRDPELRQAAIHGLGISDADEAGEPLLQIYRASPDQDTRLAVIDALFVQDNAKALIGLFRAEKDPGLKKAIVQKLSIMDDEEASEELLKLLDQ